MRNLLLFFAKYGSSFLFIFLEIICFYLIVRFNHNQREIYLHSSNLFTGKVFEQKQVVSEYFSSASIRDSVQFENGQLLRRLIYYEGYGKSPEIDTAEFHYKVIPAIITNQTLNTRSNYLTLNKGKKAGIDKDMGLITNEGIVGIVINANNNFSRAISILNSNTRISASVKGKGYFGNLVWKNLDPTRMSLEAIPKHAQLSVGDSIVTSGYSTIFPPDVYIGKIENFEFQKGNANYNIDVLLNNDMSKQKYVYVIKNLLQEDQKEIEEEDE